VADGHVWVVALDLGATGPPDVATVDLLARVALAARRRGCVVSVTGADADLAGLLDLCGLARAVRDVLVLAPTSAVGVVRQPEQLEEPATQEHGDGADRAP
jgi:hypothetical protein